MVFLLMACHNDVLQNTAAKRSDILLDGQKISLNCLIWAHYLPNALSQFTVSISTCPTYLLGTTLSTSHTGLDLSL